MSNVPSSFVERLHAYCLSKSGSLPSITFGESHPSYHILGDFLRSFAQFFLDESPIRLKLRCTLSDLENPPQGVRLQISKDMHWGGNNWRWADVWLDEILDDAVFTLLLDSSYALCMAELDPTDVRLAKIADEALTLHDNIHELIDLYQLTHRRHEIEALIQPAILLHTYPVEEDALSTGQSRIGGVPDFPAGWGYPNFDDKPLAFLAQINLQEISSAWSSNLLPPTGMLYFFSVFGWQLDNGDLHPDLPWNRSEEPRFSQVVYFSGAISSLQRQPKPVGIKTFKPTAVRFESIPSLPRASAYTRDPIVRTLGWSENEFERLNDLYFAFNLVLKRKLGSTPKHQLLGYPDVIQAAVTQGDSRLLCQIDSDYHNLDTDMMWGDGGMIYFTLSPTDLASKNFTHIYSDLQSG